MLPHKIIHAPFLPFFSSNVTHVAIDGIFMISICSLTDCGTFSTIFNLITNCYLYVTVVVFVQHKLFTLLDVISSLVSAQQSFLIA